MRIRLIFAAVLLLSGTAPGCARSGRPRIHVFAGAAVKAPLDDFAEAWGRREGIAVEITYGGSGAVLSQMMLAKAGDVYISGSEAFMAEAVRQGVVDASSQRTLAVLVPVIAVRKGNPKRIRSIEDLSRPGLRVGIGDPETVCVGAVALDLFRAAGLWERIRPNVVVHAKSCEDVAAVLALGQVDAVLGWDVFDDLRPEDIEVVPLPPEQRFRTDRVLGAVAVFSGRPDRAALFLRELAGPEGRAAFERHGYSTGAP